MITSIPALVKSLRKFMTATTRVFKVRINQTLDKIYEFRFNDVHLI